MRRDHWQWLESHLQEVNEAFEIDLSLDTPKARNIAEDSIDIYDTEDAFNDDFEGVYLRRECALHKNTGYRGDGSSLPYPVHLPYFGFSKMWFMRLRQWRA